MNLERSFKMIIPMKFNGVAFGMRQDKVVLVRQAVHLPFLVTKGNSFLSVQVIDPAVRTSLNWNHLAVTLSFVHLFTLTIACFVHDSRSLWMVGSPWRNCLMRGQLLSFLASYLVLLFYLLLRFGSCNVEFRFVFSTVPIFRYLDFWDFIEF